MKNVFKMFAILCCLTLLVACGEDDEENDGNGDGEVAAGAMSCTDTCEEDSDCGDADDWTCDEVCEYTGEAVEIDPCEDDTECIATLSGWQTECTEQADCPGQVCVDVDGTGYCATEPSEVLTCADVQQVEADYPNIEGDADLTICAQPAAVCLDSGACFVPQCEEDTDCGDNEACFDGYCGCDNDDACEEDNADTCYDGVCGCSGDEVCGDDQICNEI